VQPLVGGWFGGEEKAEFGGFREAENQFDYFIFLLICRILAQTQKLMQR
jgi:hypothetical protein